MSRRNDVEPGLLQRRPLRALWRPALAVIAAGAVAIALAACGRSSSSGGSQASTTSHTLIALEPTVAQGLDWDGAEAATEGTGSTVPNLYDFLAEFKTTEQNGIYIPDYTKFTPQLATSWSHSGDTWTFHLRHGVYSCAGNELTAQDVVWSAARAKSVSGSAPIAWFLWNHANVLGSAVLDPKAPASVKKLHGEVTAVNKYTVKIVTKPYNGTLLAMLEAFGTAIVDSKAAMSHATASDPWAHKWMESSGAAGFGPYCLKSWTPGESMTLTANPRYYGPKPQFTTVIERAVPQDADRIAAIESGQAQVVGDLTPQEFDQIAKSGRANVLSFYSNQDIELGLNYNDAPWGPNGSKKAKLLRQAVAYAVPYNTIVKNAYYDQARQWYSLVPADYLGYTPIKTYSTDVAKAKQLLAEAGYPDGRGLSGPGLSLSYVAERGSLLEPIAEQIQTALAQVGIHITLNPVPQAIFGTREAVSKNLPFYILDQIRPIGPDPAYALQLQFVSSAKGGLENSENYSSPTIDRYWAIMQNTANAATVKHLSASAQQTLMDDLPDIPVVQVKSQVAVQKGISGYYGKTSPPFLTSFAYFHG